MPNRAAIITGASSGIGLAIAKMLGEEGHALTLAARRPEKLTAAADELRDAGFDVQEVAGNMADEDTIKSVVAAHRDRYGRLDVLVNNAGVGVGAPAGEHETKRIDLQLSVNLRAIFLYSIADKRAQQVTDGLSDATAPAFDASGKYLYFLASTNYALRISWLEMTSIDRPATRAVYLAVLSAGDPSPLLPETGDEPLRVAGDGGKPAPPPPVRVDIKGIDQRILALGVPAGDYASLAAGPAGSVFYLETPRGGGPAPLTLHRYQLRERRAAPFLEGIRSYSLSGDGKKLLYRADGNRWGVVVTLLLALGSIPLFVGLAFVLPWLGYSTWHLYTRLVDRSGITPG